MIVHNALTAEHGEIHGGLARASREPGPIGVAAQRVARYFSDHAKKEDELVVPLLSLLPAAAEGKLDAEMADALPVFDRLEGGVADLQAEHRMIAAALELLVAAAKAEDRTDLGELSVRLMAHVRLEEAVIYPAALLLGRYLRVRFGRPEPAHMAQPSHAAR